MKIVKHPHIIEKKFREMELKVISIKISGL